VPSSTFSIRPMAELDSVGINVAADDVLFNLVTKDTQLMRGIFLGEEVERRTLYFSRCLLSLPHRLAMWFLIALHQLVRSFLQISI
jgi:hypothetical protein